MQVRHRATKTIEKADDLFHEVNFILVLGVETTSRGCVNKIVNTSIGGLLRVITVNLVTMTSVYLLSSWGCREPRRCVNHDPFNQLCYR